MDGEFQERKSFSFILFLVVEWESRKFDEPAPAPPPPPYTFFPSVTLLSYYSSPRIQSLQI